MDKIVNNYHCLYVIIIMHCLLKQYILAYAGHTHKTAADRSLGSPTGISPDLPKNIAPAEYACLRLWRENGMLCQIQVITRFSVLLAEQKDPTCPILLFLNIR